MRTRKQFRRAVVTLTLACVANPLTVFGQSPAVPKDRAVGRREPKGAMEPIGVLPQSELARAQVHDVRLDAKRNFRGVVVDGQGKPLVDREVSITRNQVGIEPRSVRTDARGRFVFSDVSGGTYQLHTEQGISVCRLWTADAAPPAAAPALLVVDDPQVERGQRPLRELFVMDPVLMATVVAAAIAIPIVIHKSRDDAPPGS